MANTHGLAEDLHILLLFLGSRGLWPPSPDIRIIEIGPNTPQSEGHYPETDFTRFVVDKNELKKPEDYEERWKELLGMGLSWINLSCYGVYEDLLIVAVELPSETEHYEGTVQPRKLYPGHTTSVNLSGPCKAVQERKWNVSWRLDIRENPMPKKTPKNLCYDLRGALQNAIGCLETYHEDKAELSAEGADQMLSTALTCAKKAYAVSEELFEKLCIADPG